MRLTSVKALIPATHLTALLLAPLAVLHAAN